MCLTPVLYPESSTRLERHTQALTREPLLRLGASPPAIPVPIGVAGLVLEYP